MCTDSLTCTQNVLATEFGSSKQPVEQEAGLNAELILYMFEYVRYILKQVLVDACERMLVGFSNKASSTACRTTHYRVREFVFHVEQIFFVFKVRKEI